MRFGRKYEDYQKRWFAWKPVPFGPAGRWAWLEWVWRTKVRFGRNEYNIGKIRGRSPSDK